MAETKKATNVRQKLAKARLDFLNEKVKKTGINPNLEFKYFELDDIVPVALRIFAEVGLVNELNINPNAAVMKLYNADDLEEKPMIFSIPFRENPPIISKAGKEVTNTMQSLGTSITYLRRYLWMMVLDVTEPDGVDNMLGAEEKPEIAAPNKTTTKKAKEETTKKTAPPTQDERKKTTKKLTDKDGQADELQIKALKEVCKELISKDEEQEDFVQKIAMATKGMTEISREKCEALIQKIKEMLSEYEEATE